MMKNKSKIKIVKKRDIQNLRNKSETDQESNKELTRKMIRTVSAWAQELRRKRHEESKHPFELFMSDSAQIERV